jgi:hypothetical protein
MYMKKLFFIVSALFFMNTAFAQQEAYDAFSFSQPYYFSTARSAAMGGASGALRSDMGAIAVNPAAIVTYKTNEFIFTPEFYRVQSTTNYHDLLNSMYKNDVNNNNAGFVFSIQPKYSSTRYNFGFAYNKLNAFNANEIIQGVSVPIEGSYWHEIADVAKSGADGREKKVVNAYQKKSSSVTGKYLFNEDGSLPVSGQVKQRDKYSTTGHMGEYALSFGANVSEKVYLGASVILRDTRKSFISEFHEESESDSVYRYNYNRMCNVSGLGFGGKVGILVLPVPAFSIGLSVQIPTFYSLIRRSEGRISIPSNAASASQNKDATPYDKHAEISYNLTTPLQLTVSLGYTFQNVAQVTLDYDATPYGMAKYSNAEGDALVLDSNNELLKESRFGSSLRLGSEFYVWQGWIARVGGGYLTGAGTQIKAIYNVGAGFGYDFGNAAVDLSYVFQQQDHEYPLYTSSDLIKTTYTKQFIALSLAYRF